MIVKVEPTGCCERKGMVQVRICMYLEPTDARYDEHHVQLPVIPPEGYQGKVDETGSPVDIDDYNHWIDGLPKVWQNNPFHNHFIYVEPDTPDEEIMDKAEAFSKEAYAKWSKNEAPHVVNPPLRKPLVDSARLASCEVKVQHLKDTPLQKVIVLKVERL